jgi:hypothetical protein
MDFDRHHDARVRRVTFEWVAQQVEIHGEVIPRTVPCKAGELSGGLGTFLARSDTGTSHRRLPGEAVGDGRHPDSANLIALFNLVAEMSSLYLLLQIQDETQHEGS